MMPCGEREARLIEREKPGFDVRHRHPHAGVGAGADPRMDEVHANDFHRRGKEHAQLGEDVLFPVLIDPRLRAVGGAAREALLGGGTAAGIGGGGEPPKQRAFDEADAGDFEGGGVEEADAHGQAGRSSVARRSQPWSCCT